MSYTTRPAVGRLRGIVDRMWHVESGAATAGTETICPDGCAEIVLHLGDPMRQVCGRVTLAQPRYLLVGQMERAVTIRPTGRVAMVGARLTPAALHRLLPMPQDRLTGQILDLEAVWGSWTRQTSVQVAAAAHPEAALDLLERALEALVAGAMRSASDPLVDAAVARLERTGGTASITKLAGDLGLSRRHLERRFRKRVGLPPRLFGRIVKFQRAFQALGTDTGAAIAARCGYADQAHLVREMRRFAGQTPTVLAEADGLTAFFRG